MRDGFIKFVKRQTTVVSSSETAEWAVLPALSFCPGYRSGHTAYYDLVEELHRVMDGEGEDEDDDSRKMTKRICNNLAPLQ